MKLRDKVVARAEEELGYMEKKSAGSQLDPKVGPDVGSGNATKYARDIGHTQCLAWCETFVHAILVYVLGRENADKLLYGMLHSASTMEVKNKLAEKGRLIPLSQAQPGDILYRSRNGGGHVGICAGRDEFGQIVSIEGNTSSTDKTAWNGGMVAMHHGGSWQWCARLDWSLVEEVEVTPVTGKLLTIADLHIRNLPDTSGSILGTYPRDTYIDIVGKSETWFKTSKGWVSGKYLVGWVMQNEKWWYLEDGYRYPAATVKTIDGKDYAFDKAGWMITSDRIDYSGAIIY